jgi:hypothetical protein
MSPITAVVANRKGRRWAALSSCTTASRSAASAATTNGSSARISCTLTFAQQTRWAEERCSARTAKHRLGAFVHDVQKVAR